MPWRCLHIEIEYWIFRWISAQIFSKPLKTKAQYVYLLFKMTKNCKICAEVVKLLLLKTSLYTWFDLKPKENAGDDVIKHFLMVCFVRTFFLFGFWCACIVTAQPFLHQLWFVPRQNSLVLNKLYIETGKTLLYARVFVLYNKCPKSRHIIFAQITNVQFSDTWDLA